MGLINSKVEDILNKSENKRLIFSVPKTNNDYLLFLDFLSKNYEYRIYQSDCFNYIFDKIIIKKEKDVLKFIEKNDTGIILLEKEILNNILKLFNHEDEINNGDVILMTIKNKTSKIKYLKLG